MNLVSVLTSHAATSPGESAFGVRVYLPCVCTATTAARPCLLSPDASTSFVPISFAVSREQRRSEQRGNPSNGKLLAVGCWLLACPPAASMIRTRSRTRARTHTHTPHTPALTST